MSFGSEAVFCLNVFQQHFSDNIGPTFVEDAEINLLNRNCYIDLKGSQCLFKQACLFCASV